MGYDLAAAATTLAVGFFQRLLTGTSDKVADVTAGKLVQVLDNISGRDPLLRSAMTTLRSAPGDPVAVTRLEQRIETLARQDPAFRDYLSAFFVDTRRPAGGAVAVSRGPAIALNNSPSARISQKNVTRKSGALWLLGGMGMVLLVIILVFSGVARAFVRDHVSFFETKTDVEATGGWSYRVSEAHLKTSPQLNGRGPAKPGYRYLYFDITVENLIDDREAPGIEFNFARAENTLAPECGKVTTGNGISLSPYAAGIVAGWCLSRNDSLLSGGASCYEANDSFLRTIDNLPPGGKNQVRCVDSYLVGDDFDVNSVRVYYLGADIILGKVDVTHLRRIPATT